MLCHSLIIIFPFYSLVEAVPINEESTACTSNEAPDKPANNEPIESKVQVTWSNLGNQKRRFNFDLIPKVSTNIITYILYCIAEIFDIDRK